MPLLGKLAFQGVGRKMESGQPSLLMAMVMMMMGVGVNSYPFCTENGIRCISSYENFRETMQDMQNSAFTNYDPILRPSPGFPNPVPIEVSVSLVHIRGLDAGKRELESVLDLTVKWEDQRMMMMEGYNFEGLTLKLTSNLGEVWHPHFFYTNGLKPPTPSWNFDPAKVLWTQHGEVTWKQSQVVTTFCDFNPESNTPQNCDIRLGFLFPDDVKFHSSSLSVGPHYSYAGYDVTGSLVSLDKWLMIFLEFIPTGSG